MVDGNRTWRDRAATGETLQDRHTQAGCTTSYYYCKPFFTHRHVPHSSKHSHKHVRSPSMWYSIEWLFGESEFIHIIGVIHPPYLVVVRVSVFCGGVWIWYRYVLTYSASRCHNMKMSTKKQHYGLISRFFHHSPFLNHLSSDEKYVNFQMMNIYPEMAIILNTEI